MILAFELFDMLKKKRMYFYKDCDFSKETDSRFKNIIFHGYCRVKPFDVENDEYLSRIDKESKRRYGKSIEEMIPEIKEMYRNEGCLYMRSC